MEAFKDHDKCVNNEGNGLGSDNNGGCYAPTMQCSSKMEQEDIWSQLKESLVYNDFPTDAGNASDDGRAREQVRGESDEVLVELDYEVDEELPATTPAKKVNYDFGFGTIEGQEVRADDTDYRDSDELRSLSSTDDEGNKFKEEK
ncbi:hypothetical protein Fot_42873 [Forsythia ovata]|uniref:Uncharacterized protein n=1 Tax=Forsythia ovata TaxID=205694 RepID=A0ABD1RMZ2_9LAMI